MTSLYNACFVLSIPIMQKKEYFLRKHRGKREKTRENKIFEKVFKGKNFLFYIFAKKKRSLNGKCAKICPSAKAEGQIVNVISA